MNSKSKRIARTKEERDNQRELRREFKKLLLAVIATLGRGDAAWDFISPLFSHVKTVDTVDIDVLREPIFEVYYATTHALAGPYRDENDTPESRRLAHSIRKRWARREAKTTEATA
jgi:hypothetical protein